MQNQSFSIVACDSAHIESAAILFDQYRQFYGKQSDAAAARTFLESCLRQSKSCVFLALTQTDHAGIGFMQLYPSFSSLSLKPVWILNDLYVRPESRQQGVARALVRRAQQLAIETGAAGLSLQTAITNEPAQKLYEGLSWKRDNEFYTYVWSPDAT